jgi:hypothetical protein
MAGDDHGSVREQRWGRWYIGVQGHVWVSDEPTGFTLTIPPQPKRKLLIQDFDPITGKFITKELPQREVPGTQEEE